jgi:hypothetical protein
MKKKLLELRKRFLQSIADYILFKLEITQNQNEYEQLLFWGLWLDDWCKEHDIWLV